MGYRSDGSGIFKLRNPDKKEDAIKMLGKIAEEAGNSLEHSVSDDGDFQIDFYDWKIYVAGGDFKKIMELFNGFFEIHGEEPEDVSRLVFRDGKSFVQSAIFSWQAEEETDLSGKQWD